MPGLVDAHIHAPQYKYTGASYHMSMEDTHNQYKVPNEAKFSNVEVAEKVYTPLVVCLVRKWLEF